MRRGDVWWAEHPDIGRRPYLVITRDEAIPVLDSVVCAPLTRTVRGIPSELRLGPDDGVPEASAASFDNLVTLPKWGLVERITRLSPDRLAALCFSLRAATGC